MSPGSLLNECMYDSRRPRLHKVGFLQRCSERSLVCTPRLEKTGSGLCLSSGPTNTPHRDQSCFPCQASEKGSLPQVLLDSLTLSSIECSLFTYTKTAHCHVFHGLTFMKIELARCDLIQERK